MYFFMFNKGLNMKNIQWYVGDQQNLLQAFSSGVEFSFASPNDIQVSPFAYCKDYLQDAVHGFLTKKTSTIFGFTYDPKKHEPIALNKTKLLVTNSIDFEFSNKIVNCLDFLNQIEKHLKIRKTKAEECDNVPLQYLRSGIWLFEGSKRWINSPPMLSLYTLLIRLGFGHTIGTPFEKTIDGICSGAIKPYQKIDVGRLKKCKSGIKKILRLGDREIFDSKIKNNYPRTVLTRTMHNTMGIVGFSSGRTKSYVPSWHVKK